MRPPVSRALFGKEQEQEKVGINSPGEDYGTASGSASVVQSEPNTLSRWQKFKGLGKSLARGVLSYYPSLMISSIVLAHIMIFNSMKSTINRMADNAKKDCEALSPFGQYWGDEQANFNGWISMPGNRRDFTDYCGSLSNIMGMVRFAMTDDGGIDNSGAQSYGRIFFALGLTVLTFGFGNMWLNCFRNRSSGSTGMFKAAFLTPKGSYFPLIMSVIPVVPFFAVAPYFFLKNFSDKISAITAYVVTSTGQIAFKLTESGTVDAVKQVCANPFGLTDPYFLAPIQTIYQAAQNAYTEDGLTPKATPDIVSYIGSWPFLVAAPVLFLACLPLLRRMRLTAEENEAVAEDISTRRARR